MAVNGVTRRVGVLFVHGIGEQQKSESVRWFGGALLGWLRPWYEARVPETPPIVVSAQLSYGAKLEGPPRFTIRLPASSGAAPDDLDAEWLLAEAHWADRISPPSFGAMLEWAWRSAGLVVGRLRRELGATLDLIRARITGGLSRRERLAKSDPGLLAAIFELMHGIVLLVLYSLSLILLPLVLVPLFIVSLVPIPAWRRFVVVQLIEPFLVKGIGDFRTFVEDDVQAAHIRAGVVQDIEWLATEGRCEDIVVIAHSQGAVVAFDALTGSPSPAIGQVRKFFTVGGALNNAWHLYGTAARLRRTLPRHIHWVDFWSYYDPVPGSRLRPPAGARIVDPTPELQREMSWYQEYVEPGFGGERRTPPSAPLPRQVTNSMNVLTDHDGYFRNPEQFLSRLASEIDRPREDYERSRFHHGLEKQLSFLRRSRVSTLVSWRLYAMVAFFASLALVVAREGLGPLWEIGARIGSWVSRIPGADVLGAPSALVDAGRQVLDAIAKDPGAPAWPSDASGRVAGFLADPLWSIARDVLIGVLFVGLLFVAAYFALTRVLYRPWDDRESRGSVLKEIPERTILDVYGRGAAVLAVLVALAAAVVAGL